MFKHKKLLCLLLVALLMVTACAPTTGKPEEPPKEEAPAEETSKEGEETPAEEKKQPEEEASGDYLVWNIGSDPKTWDPQMNTAANAGHMIVNLYDGLVRDTLEGIKMASAESYELTANEEGVADTVYTFKLKDGLKWSDGKPLTAKDYEYAWLRACSPELASPYAFLVCDYIKGAQDYFDGKGKKEDVKIKALDDRTLQVELMKPTAYFLNLLSFFTYMPCREDMASTGEGWEKDPAKCITNGAFVLEEYKVGSHVKMKKNEHFWNAENVHLAGIKGLFIEDPNTALQGYEAGDIHVNSVIPGEEVPRLLAEDPNYQGQPGLGTAYIIYNVDVNPVDDLNVRKALSLAIDRNMITDKILRDGSVPAAAFVAPTFKLSDGKSMRKMDANGKVEEEYEINPWAAKEEEAKKYLADAGYPNGEGFPELELLYSQRGNESLIAEALQQMWEKTLGIKVSLKAEEWSVFLDTRRSGKFVVAMGGWSADYNDPMTMLALFTSTGLNDARWRWQKYEGDRGDEVLNPENQAYDEAVNIASETSGEERDKAMIKAEDVLMENMIIAPLYYSPYKHLINFSKVEGPGRTPIGQWDFQYYKMVK